MLTKDFTGVYDYEREEAQNEADYFVENIVPDSTPEECAAYVTGIAKHWRVVLTPQGFADFASAWNSIVINYPIAL